MCALSQNAECRKPVSKLMLKINAVDVCTDKILQMKALIMFRVSVRHLTLG